MTPQICVILDFCNVRVKSAVELDASRAEIFEATGVAILMAGGPALAQVSTEVLDALEEAGV